MVLKALKCSHCHIVVNELLAYVQNKVSIADEVSLVQICASAFSYEQIEQANNLLFESLPSELCKTGRKGKGKENRLLHDIINVFKVTDPDHLPVFVARDLEKLPPITFDHLDVSKLLKDLVVVQAEIKHIKSTYATMEQLEKLKNDCVVEKISEIPSSRRSFVNMKRGAYRDSGPIGVLQLDDTIVTNCMDQSHCEASSPKDNSLEYRSIKQVEGSCAFQSGSKQATGQCVTGAGGGRGSELGVGRAVNSDSSRVPSDEANDQRTQTLQIPTYSNVTRVQNSNDGSPPHW